jgi:hypothetical protein
VLAVLAAIASTVLSLGFSMIVASAVVGSCAAILGIGGIAMIIKQKILCPKQPQPQPAQTQAQPAPAPAPAQAQAQVQVPVDNQEREWNRIFFNSDAALPQADVHIDLADEFLSPPEDENLGVPAQAPAPAPVTPIVSTRASAPTPGLSMTHFRPLKNETFEVTREEKTMFNTFLNILKKKELSMWPDGFFLNNNSTKIKAPCLRIFQCFEDEAHLNSVLKSFDRLQNQRLERKEVSAKNFRIISLLETVLMGVDSNLRHPLVAKSNSFNNCSTDQVKEFQNGLDLIAYFDLETEVKEYMVAVPHHLSTYKEEITALIMDAIKKLMNSCFLKISSLKGEDKKQAALQRVERSRNDTLELIGQAIEDSQDNHGGGGSK